MSYPLDQISRTSKVTMTGRGNDVKNIFFLSFDAFGVLPPISLLDNHQAVRFFELGYTSKVAGTEVGIDEPTTVFSPCFGDRSYRERYLTTQNYLEKNLWSFQTLKCGW